MSEVCSWSSSTSVTSRRPRHWGDWYGRTITAQALSKLLRPYRIKTTSVKVDGTTVRGYKVEGEKERWSCTTGREGVSENDGARAASPG